MSAPKEGRQSPAPEDQTPDQQSAHPAQPGSGKIDNSQAKNEGKHDQTSGLTSNPDHPLGQHASDTTAK